MTQPHLTDDDRTDEAAADGWALTLYVNGASPRSIAAIEAVRRIATKNSAAMSTWRSSTCSSSPR